MPQITKQQLQTWAEQPDIHLYVDGGRKRDPISESIGYFSGVPVRSLKVSGDLKHREYFEAKRQVRDALIEIYGEEIGEQAFKAGVGPTSDGGPVSSQNLPLTGRQIAKMLEIAERDFRPEKIKAEQGERGDLKEPVEGLGSTNEDPSPPDGRVEFGTQPSKAETTYKTVEQRKLEETKNKYPWAKHIEISHEEFYSDPEKYVNRQQTVEVRIQRAERIPHEYPGKQWPKETEIREQRDWDSARGQRANFHSHHHINVNEDSVDVEFSSDIPFDYLRVRHHDKEIIFKPPERNR